MITDKHEIGLIVQDYKLAKNPEEQIKILAETHATGTAEIRKILYDAGVYKIGRPDIMRALEILQKKGKNHSIGCIRNWLACFQACSAKETSRILRDYRERPWAEPIPEETFAKALMKDAPEVMTIMSCDPNKNYISFDDNDRSLIIRGLTGMITEKEQLLQKAKQETEQAERQLKEAQERYDESKKKEKLMAAGLGDLEKLIDRIGREM